MSKLNLSNYKSSGVYFIETDNSMIDVIDSTSLRLVPGFSEHGPFNKPIVLNKPSDRKKIFGDSVNTKLERNGCFFERTLDILLEDGEPVIALNLLNVSNADKVDAVSFATCINNEDNKHGVESCAYSEFFDRSRFWTPSTENLLMVATQKTGNDVRMQHLAPIFNVVNIGTSDITVFIIKDTTVAGYNMTLDKWYNGEELPYAWMNKNDFVSDYFVKVVAIKGDWSNASMLSTDLTWSKYFDANGLKISEINKFLVADGVNIIGNWSGCIIPNFYNKAGDLVSIQDIVNASTTTTGVMIAINEYAMENYEAATYKIDMNGKLLADGSVNMLSYNEIDANSIKFDAFIEASRVEADVCGKELQNYEFLVNIDANTMPMINDYIVIGVDNNKTISRIIKRQLIESKTEASNTKYYKFTCMHDIADLKNSEAKFQHSLTDMFESVCLTKLSGLKLTNAHRPGYDENGMVSFEDGISKVYEMLNDEGIKRGLLDPEMISFRYIVDTMAGGLGTGLEGKNILANIAKERGKCTAIINFPSVTEMNMSSDPLFCDADNTSISKQFKTEYIPMGGNPDAVCTNPLTLPLKDEGADYAAVFSPFLKYRDGSRTILIPPAAHVAKLFNTKYAAGADQYMTMANRNGILNDSKIVGLEYQYDQKDRDYLEPFGVNPIIKQNGNIMIYGDRTCYQEVLSDLNYLHVRELLNTIELECYEVLKGYVFQKNNELTRAEIIRKLAPILDEKVNAGALYSYSIKMDTENNTEEIINRSFAIVDIEVQCTKNMEKILTHIKINKYQA